MLERLSDVVFTRGEPVDVLNELNVVDSASAVDEEKLLGLPLEDIVVAVPRVLLRVLENHLLPVEGEVNLPLLEGDVLVRGLETVLEEPLAKDLVLDLCLVD